MEGSRLQFPGVSQPLFGRRRNVPEGQYDRSLARSAWGSATPKSRPVGYGMISIGGRTDSMRSRSHKTLQMYVVIFRAYNTILPMANTFSCLT
jgi:hypothetical protein